MRAEIELTCFSAAGIDAIKAALHAAQNVSTTAIVIRAQLISPPKYILTTSSIDAKAGLALLGTYFSPRATCDRF